MIILGFDAPSVIFIALTLALVVVCGFLMRHVTGLEHEICHLKRNLEDTFWAVRVDEHHPILEAILDERKKNAGDFSIEGSGVRGEAKDKAILACYYAVEAVLKRTGIHTPVGKA